MKTKIVRRVVLAFSLGAALGLSQKRARAESPPVDVHVADDDEEDFFSDSKAKKKAEPEPAPAQQAQPAQPEDAKDEVRRHAKDAFDELDAMEKGVTVKKGKKKTSADNENTNTQVVNVVVVGEKDTKTVATQKADNENKQQNLNKDVPPAQGGVMAPSGPARTTRETIDHPITVRRGPPPPPPPMRHDKWSDWWERPSYIEAGDVWVFYSVGGYAGGIYQGLGFEGLFSDWGGLRLVVHGDLFNHSDWGNAHADPIGINQSNVGFFVNAAQPTPTATGRFGTVFGHMEELSFTLHLGSRWHGLDLSPSIGVAHMGYSIDSSDQGLQRGGTGYLRAGAALNWFYKRFFLGVDVGWYPVQLFSYTIEQRGEQQDVGARFVNNGNGYDSHRITLSGHMGLSF
jgi:hypothetical protein